MAHPYYQSRNKKWAREISPVQRSASGLSSNQAVPSDPASKNENRPPLRTADVTSASSYVRPAPDFFQVVVVVVSTLIQLVHRPQRCSLIA